MSNNERKQMLERVRQKLSGQWLRMQIMIILALTGTTSFIASIVLLHFGVTMMAVRYPIAIALAYGVFIALIGLWIWLQRTGSGHLDIDPGIDIPTSASGDYATAFGGGGDFGGGGASGTWTGSGTNSPSTLTSSNVSGSSGIDLPGIDLDLDDAIWIVLAIVALLGGIIAIGYIVYIAPILFAEVLVDGLLAAGIYKTIKNAQGNLWVTTVLRKTAIPAIIILVFFTLAGYCIQRVVPEASSLGDAMRILF